MRKKLGSAVMVLRKSSGVIDATNASPRPRSVARSSMRAMRSVNSIVPRLASRSARVAAKFRSTARIEHTMYSFGPLGTISDPEIPEPPCSSGTAM